jgi:DHA1 family bicyclomycin/chloramphenicol resistance-like MFS transporter
LNITAFAIYCGLMLSLSAFSIDILLPSLMSISQGLDAALEAVQLTIPVYMLALGLANPFYGILSDRIGRRNGVFIGLGVYVFGTVVCAVSPNIDLLLIGRFLQGFGAACAPVICRAMIRDKYHGVKLAQTMAVASMFFALGPMLAPLLGYLAFATAGWRAVFMLLIMLSIAMLISTWAQEETLPVERRRVRGVQSVLADLAAVVSHVQSRRYIVLSCVATGIILTFLSHAPLIYANLGVGIGGFSVMFAVTSIGIILGQIINHRLLGIMSAPGATLLAAILLALTASLIWLSAVTNQLTGYLFTALMFVFNMSYLIIFSNLVSLTIEPHGMRAGMASATFGFCSYIGGSIVAAILAFTTGQKTVMWAFCFMLLTLLLLAGLLHAIRSTSADPLQESL